MAVRATASGGRAGGFSWFLEGSRIVRTNKMYWVKYRFENGETEVVLSHFFSRSDTAMNRSSMGGSALFWGLTNSSKSSWTTGSSYWYVPANTASATGPDPSNGMESNSPVVNGVPAAWRKCFWFRACSTATTCCGSLTVFQTVACFGSA
jgi:hypothetical protein